MSADSKELRDITQPEEVHQVELKYRQHLGQTETLFAYGAEDQLRRMIDTIPTLAWSCRLDGTTEFLNRRWLDYTGLSLEQALGWGWKVPIHPEDLGKLLDTWSSLLASGEPGEEGARLRRFDGEYRWFLFRAVPVRDERGRIVRWYGTNTDILTSDHHAWIQVARGTITLNDAALSAGDSAAVSEETRLTVNATDQAEVLLLTYCKESWKTTISLSEED